jgi:hypothetical protein
MREHRRRIWLFLITASMAAATAIVIRGVGPATADVDGNGLDEVGAFAIEDKGLARGPWLQLYDGAGVPVSDFFLGQSLSDPQIHKVDVNADGRDEIAVLGVAAGGQPLLQVRDAAGTVIASAPVAEPGATRLALFPIDIDGIAPAELGIAYTRTTMPPTNDPLAPWGAGVAQVWAPAQAAPGGLFRAAHVEAIPAGFADHAWRAIDGNGDGADELLAGYSLAPSLLAGEPTPHGAVARVFAPLGAVLLAEIPVAGNAFDGAQWLVGDFVAGNGGEELLAGLRRRLDGVGVARVYDPFGDIEDPQAGSAPLVALDATPAAVTELAWRAARRPRPIPLPGQQPAPVLHHALVGFRQADQTSGFRVWATEPPADGAMPPLPLGGGTVLAAGTTVNDWIAAELDGDPATGDGIAALYTRGDRSIAVQHWGQAGLSPLAGVDLFDSTFIEPQAVAIEAAQIGREDLAVIARRIGQAPRLELWNLSAPGVRLFGRDVLGANVR